MTDSNSLPASQPTPEQPKTLAEELHALAMNVTVPEQSEAYSRIPIVTEAYVGYRYGHHDARHAIAEAVLSDPRVAAFENLVALAKDIDTYGEALIAQQYKPGSGCVTGLVQSARACLAAAKAGGPR